MELAERLHMTLAQLLANADSRELGMWLARDLAKAEEQHNNALAARAEAALRTR